eukprot:gene19284-25143_t
MFAEEDGKRARRSTRFSGDFQTKFDLGSDEENADSDSENKKKRMSLNKSTNSQTKSKRTKDCPGCGAKHPVAMKLCTFCDYQFTNKSMLITSQSAAEESENIRESFSFEAEREDDGTLIIQSISGRRPRKSSNRWYKSSGGISALETKYDYEYFVKFKSLSYLHAKWLSASEIESMNQKSKQALNRYLTKIDAGEVVQEDGEYDPSFIEVEKILDVREEEVLEVVDEMKNLNVDIVEDIIPIEVNSSNTLHQSNSIQSNISNVVENTNPINTENTENTSNSSSYRIVNHQERCRQLLNRLWDDPFAVSFRDPVDTDVYDDYLEVVEEPMCLSDVRTKLNNNEYGKYWNHVKFAQDVRKIWRNCKIYNLYQSQIWYTAHALSMMFERLYQGWILSYLDGSIKITDPLGCPWESSCRTCLLDENDESLMLCDHCDAAFHTYCLRPKLTKVPDGPWMCPRCVKWFAKTPNAKMYSASAEDEARQYAEGARTKKVIKVKKKKYLVKWRGLSYRECTWELPEEINDDERIAAYHRINDNPPEEPPLTKAEIGYELSKDRKIQVIPPLKQPNPIQDLDATIYAQIRAYHFLKWKKLPTEALLRECGPRTHAGVFGLKETILLPNAIKNVLENKENSDTSGKSWYIQNDTDYIFNEVSDLLSNVIYQVSRNNPYLRRDPYPTRPKLPTPYSSPSEIELCLPTKLNGLNLQIGNYQGYPIVIGFKYGPNNEKYPVETSGKVKVGDVLIGIDGLYLYDLTYLQILKLIRQLFSKNDGTYKKNYTYLRFLRYSNTDEDAREVNCIKEYIEKALDNQHINNSYPSQTRSLYFGVYANVSNIYNNRGSWYVEYYDNDYKKVFVGYFDDELLAAKAYDEEINKYNLKLSDDKSVKKHKNWARNINFHDDGNLTKDARILFKIVAKERELKSEFNLDTEENINEENYDTIDVEYNSYDSRDSDSELDPSDDSDIDSSLDDDNMEEDDEWKPKPKVSLTIDSDGPMSRLLRAVNESDFAPNKSDWNNYILDMGFLNNLSNNVNDKTPTKLPAKLTRIAQVDMVSGVSIREWESVTSISRSLNVPFNDVQAVLNGKLDVAGGFKWKYVFVVSDNKTSNNEIEATVEEDDELPPIIDVSPGKIAKVKSSLSPSTQTNTQAPPKKDYDWQNKLYDQSKEYESGGKLRDYQVEGLNWLLSCWYTKRSSILADEMGLGKTVQVITFLEHLYTVENIRGPFLICVPLSTIQHWKREAESWTNMIVCLYHDAGGGRDMRDIIREYEWYYKNKSRRIIKFQLLITTYDDLIKDYEELAEIPWRVVVVDEAHRLRNVNSKLLECMREVVSKGISAYGYQHRILMTGTPLQNNTMELWTLLNFIEPAKFPDIEKFTARYGVITTQEQVESLQRRLAPHLLRRVKEDVAKDIPPKEETIIDVELTTIQKQYYRAIFEKNHSFLLQNLKGALPKLMNVQMELRKCCNHPYLVDGVEQIEMEQLDKQIDESNKQTYNKVFEKKRMEEYMIPTSGKMMVKMIDIIDEYCEFRHYPCERLDGRVSGNERQKSIDRFNTDQNSFIFLLSTRAGGVGINLTAADTVIIFDSDWNPQNDVQAMARCHRIGQSKNVTIYRLITRRSFEASMFERASKKLGLEQALLGSRQFNDIELIEDNKNSSKIDSKELEQLLKEGAYSVLLDDNSEEIKEFFEQDIEVLLEQRAHVMVTETNQPTESWLNKKKLKNKAKKSLFTGDLAMEHAEIDVNDPDFWKKVLPDLVTPNSMMERLKDEIFAIKNSNSNSEYQDDYDEDEERVAQSETIEKFMKDLKQMIEGMLDLHRRNQLPDQQRDICLKLLLRISLKEDVFSDRDISQVKEWLSTIEGSRRRARTDLGKSIGKLDLRKSLKDPKDKFKSGIDKSARKRQRKKKFDGDDDNEQVDNDDDDFAENKNKTKEVKVRKKYTRKNKPIVIPKQSIKRKKNKILPTREDLDEDLDHEKEYNDDEDDDIDDDDSVPKKKRKKISISSPLKPKTPRVKKIKIKDSNVKTGDETIKKKAGRKKKEKVKKAIIEELSDYDRDDLPNGNNGREDEVVDDEDDYINNYNIDG